MHSLTIRFGRNKLRHVGVGFCERRIVSHGGDEASRKDGQEVRLGAVVSWVNVIPGSVSCGLRQYGTGRGGNRLAFGVFGRWGPAALVVGVVAHGFAGSLAVKAISNLFGVSNDSVVEAREKRASYGRVVATDGVK